MIKRPTQHHPKECTGSTYDRQIVCLRVLSNSKVSDSRLLKNKRQDSQPGPLSNQAIRVGAYPERVSRLRR